MRNQKRIKIDLSSWHISLSAKFTEVSEWPTNGLLNIGDIQYPWPTFLCVLLRFVTGKKYLSNYNNKNSWIYKLQVKKKRKEKNCQFIRLQLSELSNQSSNFKAYACNIVHVNRNWKIENQQQKQIKTTLIVFCKEAQL